MPETKTNVCKDCDTTTDDYALSKQLGRCADCFSRYDESFRQGAESVFVNHILTLSRGEDLDQDRARAWRDRYWFELREKEGDPFSFCGHLCLRSEDIGVGIAGNPVTHPHPDCDVHGVRVQYSRPELGRLAFRTR